jgi:hypothetical protein
MEVKTDFLLPPLPGESDPPAKMQDAKGTQDKIKKKGEARQLGHSTFTLTEYIM